MSEEEEKIESETMRKDPHIAGLVPIIEIKENCNQGVVQCLLCIDRKLE